MEIPRHWRLKKQRYGLVGEVCPRCDHKIFPPRDVCPNCPEEKRSDLETPTDTKPAQGIPVDLGVRKTERVGV